MKKFIGLSLYCILTLRQFKSIDIEIDEHYKEVLNLYNKRRRFDYFLAAIILMSFVIVFEIYFIFFAKKKQASDTDEISSNQNENEEPKKVKRIEFVQNSDRNNPASHSSHHRNHQRSDIRASDRCFLHRLSCRATSEDSQSV